MEKRTNLFFLFFFSWLIVLSQEQDEIYLLDSITVNKEPSTKSPTKAALYSAVLPGMVQLYNKTAWKTPLVWGLIGAGAGFISFYQNEYNDYKSAFKSELNGEAHQFSDLGLSAESLAQSQVDLKRFRDYAIAITTLVYVLNVLDAAVDAHLFEVRNDKDLQISPGLKEYGTGRLAPSLGLIYTF